MCRVHPGIPAGDRAVFGRKHEHACTMFAISADHKVIRVRAIHVIEDDAGWGCCCASGTSCGWWDNNYEWRSWWKWVTTSIINSSVTCSVVCHPPGSVRPVRQSPGIDQVGILKLGDVGEIRDQV